MSCVYIITNLINNKIYIGKTSKTYKERWSQHISAALADSSKPDYNFLLHKAIRKYGKEQFKVELLEDNISDEESCLREQYWINFYHSSILFEENNGYNMTYGGEGTIKIDREEIFNLWDSGLGTIAISQKLNNHIHSIKYILSTYPNYNKEIDFARNNGRKVYQYDMNGKLIKEYPSISYAAREVNVDPSLINKCCSKEKQSCKEFFWSYSADEIFEPKKLRTWKQYQVIQKNLDGEEIAIFSSMSAAGKAMNKTQTKYIKECCEGTRDEMYGYKWEYKTH
jgi:group I intron endonuclease